MPSFQIRFTLKEIFICIPGIQWKVSQDFSLVKYIVTWLFESKWYIQYVKICTEK